MADSDSGDEGGGGGKQNQQSQDAKHQQRAIELENILQKDLSDLATKKQNKNLFQVSQQQESERKIKVTQREWLDQKEKEAKTSKDEQEPNPEVSLDTQVKKKDIVHLFSVTRSLALNRIAANNKDVVAQKNFGLFSKMKEQLLTTKSDEKIDVKTEEKALTNESSTLFSQHSPTKPETEDTQELENAIRQAQKIFNQ